MNNLKNIHLIETIFLLNCSGIENPIVTLKSIKSLIIRKNKKRKNQKEKSSTNLQSKKNKKLTL